MKQKAQNTFNNGMIKDLNPVTTPNNVLTDMLNGTIITYNGNEFALQNDMGNCKVERAKLSPGFIPVGMKEYGGIVYVASMNPETKECEIGSFPSPERDFSTTDFENIQPVKFQNTDFTLITTDESLKERLLKVGKLFEPELFQLHPGDQYVIVYTINAVAPTAGGQINTNDQFNSFISKDPANRKLFQLKFYKITDTNNLVEMDGTNMKVIQNKADLEDEYVFFKENSNSTIAVGLELEQLDYFDANVVDRSLKTDPNKKVGFEAVGLGASLANFQGIKVNVTKPNAQTFFIDKIGSGKKVAAILDGFAADDEFECSVIPYSPYSLYPKLKKSYKMTMGEYLTAGSDTNNLFRYKVDNGFLKVDFDYRFEGNSVDGIHLYVEFYDPWSDYSIVKTVDNPTYYGTNSVTLELITEPVVDRFDSTTVGGTLPSKLINNGDTEYEKTMLNSTNLIRTDQVLRANHFYIVRISGVDRTFDDTTQTFTYSHYDFYKGLYTNTMFNDIYDAQSGLSVGDAAYVADFDALDFDLSKIAYQGVLTTGVPLDITPTVTQQRPDLITGGKYYTVSGTRLSTTPGYKSKKTYESRRSYSVNLTLQGTQNIFGTFKENLLTIVPPTLVASDGSGGQKPVVTDDGYDQNPNIAPESRSEWTLTNVADKSYTLNANLVTSRSVYADVTEGQNNNVEIVKNVSLKPSLWYKPAGDGPFFQNYKAALRMNKYYVDVLRENGTYYTHRNDGGIDDDDLFSAVSEAGLSRHYSAILATSDEEKWTYSHQGDHDGCGYRAWRTSFLIILTDGQLWYTPTLTSDATAIGQFFDHLFVVSKTLGTAYIYYPSNVVYNNQFTTTATFPDVVFTTQFTPDAARTYLSTFRFRALGTIQDFKASVFNDYINSRKGDSTIIDGKQTLRDGFIPYIDSQHNITSTFTLPVITINQSGDTSLVSPFREGQADSNSDPAFTGSARNHGDLFTDLPEYYDSYVGMLTVKGWTPGITIDPNSVYVTAKAGTAAWPNSYFAKDSGGCSNDKTGPILYPSINITTQT